MMMNIIIDFDSTIIAEEMLERLFEIATRGDSKQKEILEEIENITNQGMNGEIPFEESLRKRMNFLALTPEHVEMAIRYLQNVISKSFLENIEKLKQYNYFIVSGGFSNIIKPLVLNLGLDTERVYANTIVFENGEYMGIDLENPLAFDLGKVNIVKQLKLSGTTLVVGDGSSDLKIKEHGLADYMFYYAEFVNRDAIAKKADLIVQNFNEVMTYLPEYSPNLNTEHKLV